MEVSLEPVVLIWNVKVQFAYQAYEIRGTQTDLLFYEDLYRDTGAGAILLPLLTRSARNGWQVGIVTECSVFVLSNLQHLYFRKFNLI